MLRDLHFDRHWYGPHQSIVPPPHTLGFAPKCRGYLRCSRKFAMVTADNPPLSAPSNLRTGIGTALTIHHLFPESDDLAFVPVLFIVGFGVSVTLVGGSSFRCCTARDIKRRLPPADVTARAHFQRQQLKLAAKIDTSLCAGLCRCAYRRDEFLRYQIAQSSTLGCSRLMSFIDSL